MYTRLTMNVIVNNSKYDIKRVNFLADFVFVPPVTKRCPTSHNFFGLYFLVEIKLGSNF